MWTTERRSRSATGKRTEVTNEVKPKVNKENALVARPSEKGGRTDVVNGRGRHVALLRQPRS